MAARIALAVSSLLAVSAQTLPPGAPVTASFPGLGSVLGVKNSSLNAHGVAYFLGVPFAATTAGENSFRAPQPRTPWAWAMSSKRGLRGFALLDPDSDDGSEPRSAEGAAPINRKQRREVERLQLFDDKAAAALVAPALGWRAL